LFDDQLAVFAALTHPFFKSNWIEDEEKKRDCKIQLKQLLSDTVSPVSDKSSASLTEDFLNFFPSGDQAGRSLFFFKRSGN
jgi:hypothetical protein